MDPFIERMIARGNLRCKRGDKQEHQICSTTEEMKLMRTYRADVSFQSNYNRLNDKPLHSKDSIPIRSPRKFKPNEASVKKTCESKDFIMQPETVPSEECPAFRKLSDSFTKAAAENEIVSNHVAQKLCTTKGEAFIPEAISTPILARGSLVNKEREISSTTDTAGSEESKNIYPCLSGCNDNIFAMDNIKVEKCRNRFQEMNNNVASSLPGNLKQEHNDWFALPHEKEKAQAIYRLKNGTGNNIENANTCSKLRGIQSTGSDIKEDKKNEMNSHEQHHKSTSVVRGNTKETFQEAGKMSLEDLDDMEDRVSELEIKVNGLKIDEIAVPGIKQAQIMTEVLPLAYTKEMEGEKVGAPIRSITLRNERGDTGGNNHKLYFSKFKENLEDKKSTVHGSLKEPNDNRSLNCEGHILNEYVDESNYSNQRYSILANTSRTDTSNFSERNDDTLTESSCDEHSEHSIHSGDFSFSCSCSTSISQSSFHHEIPNESLPFLILQNLSYNRKGCSNSREPKLAQVIHKGDNIDSAVQSESDNQEGSRKEYSLKELKVNQLHRKVLMESTTMEQASKALSLCYSSLTFYGSPQQIEGERLLLLSTLRKQAFLDEIRRLEAQTKVFLKQTESIEVKIEKIRIHLMEDFLSKITTTKQNSDSYHFICIVSHKENVISSEVIQANLDQPSIEFQPKNFKFEGQFCNDLAICFRVHALQVTKYAGESGKTRAFARKTLRPNKEKISSVTCHSPCICTCKPGDSETKSNSIDTDSKVQSTVRIPSFVLTARTEMCLPKDLNKTSLQLEQYEPFCCNGNHFKVLQDTMSLNIVCTFKTTRCDSTIDKYISKDHQGFLSRFSIIGGIGAWQREWWCLKGAFLLSWKYPEDEDYLPPIRVIDLKLSTKKISPVPRRKCARRNTFLIIQNASRNFQGEEQGSMYVWDENRTSATVAEHILSADTREEMDNWCKKLNGILYLLQSWRVIPNFFQT